MCHWRAHLVASARFDGFSAAGYRPCENTLGVIVSCSPLRPPQNGASAIARFSTLRSRKIRRPICSSKPRAHSMRIVNTVPKNLITESSLHAQLRSFCFAQGSLRLPVFLALACQCSDMIRVHSADCWQQGVSKTPYIFRALQAVLQAAIHCWTMPHRYKNVMPAREMASVVSLARALGTKAR